MNATYKFGVSYYDAADGVVGILFVEAMAESPERASLKIEEFKDDKRWLMKALDVQDADDIDGVIVGEHVLIGDAKEVAHSVDQPLDQRK